MIEIKNLRKTYKSKKSIDTKAINGINLSFDDTGLIFIVGKSGSGKSTLLNLLGGLDGADSGEILINNKNILKLNDKELDYYRNSYVGFIFQEFNLLEELNVYENINLSLKLQNKEDKGEIKKILKQVDLSNLENRNINELSGGQKQRVSITRAIIKKPKLILADEPTGNLDRKSTDQIFSILKEISKTSLVIVVSHDIDSAYNFADRIIKIEDGKVLSDSKKFSIKKNDEDIKLEKSKLPFNYIFKLAYSYLMSNPLRLVLTILLTMISISFMCFALNVSLFNENDLLINTMKDNKTYNLNIDYRNVMYDDNGNRQEKALYLEKDNIEYLEKVTNSKANNKYLLIENGNNLGFKFGEVSEEYRDNKAYTFIPNSSNFVSLEDTRIINKIIGSYPENNNEIVIHKYFADYIILFGVYDINNELYKPNSYEDIVNDKKSIRLSTHDVRIVGIVDDDNKVFRRSFITGEFWSNDFERYYNEVYTKKSNLIYVNNNFINDIELENNLNIDNLHIRSNNNEDKNIRLLKNKIKYINLENKDSEIDVINKNEVIISMNTLRLFMNDYNSNLDSYIDIHSNLVYDDIIKNYTKEYIKEGKLNNKVVTLINNSLNSSSNELKVIGVSYDNNNYISSEYEGEYTNSEKKITSTIIYCDEDKALKNVYEKLNVLYDDEYNTEGNKYLVSYDNSLRVSYVIYVYKMIRSYLLTLALVFIIFTSLLILNFISNSIMSFKKQIGILRSSGATLKDILKIFGCETLLINIISFVFGLIIWLIECKILNNSIFGNTYFILNGIVINMLVPLIVFMFDIFITLIITILLINKVNEVKPIDVILNK